VHLQWIGARRRARVEGQARLPGVSNYLLGNDPARWRTDIPQFGRVKFSGVYPSIDLVYYGKQRQLEYDAILAPHADPRQLRLRIRGAGRIHISAEGDLVLSAVATLNCPYWEIARPEPTRRQRPDIGKRLALCSRACPFTGLVPVSDSRI